MSSIDNSSPAVPLKFKVVLIGDACCGKTAFVTKHRTGDFTTEYIPTMGVEVNPVCTRFSDYGKVILNIWDCAGDEKFGGLRTGYYIGAQAAIVMFDVTNSQSFASLSKRLKDLKRVRPNIPIVLCGNKTDCSNRAITTEHLSRFLEVFSRMEMEYYDISVKTDYNLEKLFLSLLRKLVK